MRPVVYGILLTILGLLGWFIFSFLVAMESLSGTPSMINLALMYIFGMLFFFSIPISIVTEIVRWIRKKAQKANC